MHKSEHASTLAFPFILFIIIFHQGMYIISIFLILLTHLFILFYLARDIPESWQKSFLP